jgi:hypothetical protein
MKCHKGSLTYMFHSRFSLCKLLLHAHVLNPIDDLYIRELESPDNRRAEFR